MVRPPAVAGLFYDDDAEPLRRTVRRYVQAGSASAGSGQVTAAIGPHAGYRYSGPICGHTYAALSDGRDRFRRVLLIGPAHRVAFTGLATSTADAFATPLGDVAVDRDAVTELEQHDAVQPHDRAHAPEHGLEVHLPFLQVVLGDIPIVPLLFGDVTGRETAEAIAPPWTDETLLMVSSDLSHYHRYEEAKQIDRSTADAIEQGHAHAITGAAACGHVAIQALMHLAGERGLTARTLDLRTSGDTAGPRDQVVGYGAFVYA